MQRITALAILIAALAVQAQGPSLTNGTPNGLAWRSLSVSDKAMFLNGAMAAFTVAYDDQMARAAQMAQTDLKLGCMRSITDGASTWFKGSTQDLRREMDEFYETAANIPIPVPKALGYSKMKVGGASEQELKAYRAVALQDAVQ